MPNKPSVFISYRRESSEDLARLIHDRLKADGVDVFYDLDDIEPGERWRVRLQKELVNRDYLLVILAQDTLENSEWVRREIKTALDQNKTIIPVTHKGFIFRQNLIPDEIAELSEFNGIRFEQQFSEAAFDKIKGALNITINVNVPQLAPPPQPPKGMNDGLKVVIVGGIITGIFAVIVALVNVLPDILAFAPTPTTQASVISLSATASPTPSSTPVPASETPAPSSTPVPTSETPTPSDTPAATIDIEGTAAALPGYPNGNPITTNSQWTPVMQTFDDIHMVLVPKGCFDMGSATGLDDEQPVETFCFKTPFWIYRYEVTNAQYGSSGEFSGDNRPRESVNWSDAKAFCENRGARLPNEAEWEYAARGPSGWTYPWGNNLQFNNLVYYYNSNNQTAQIGSKPGGVSWVGALDMSGNVWEWVSTIYDQDQFSYPYKLDDGREDLNRAEVLRGLRGGSWNGIGRYLRAANRNKYKPANENNGVGFRCARDYS